MNQVDLSVLPLAERQPVPVLYADMDGTIRHCASDPSGYVNGPEDVAIYPGVPELLRRYRKAGWRVIAVSNQGGIALGIVSEDQVAAALARTWELCDRQFDRIAYCAHHPDADDPDIAACWCRKPRIGMLVQAAAELEALNINEFYPTARALMVGDMESDRLCAENAGIRYVEAEEWRAASWAGHPWNAAVAT